MRAKQAQEGGGSSHTFFQHDSLSRKLHLRQNESRNRSIQAAELS